MLPSAKRTSPERSPSPKPKRPKTKPTQPGGTPVVKTKAEPRPTPTFAHFTDGLLAGEADTAFAALEGVVNASPEAAGQWIHAAFGEASLRDRLAAEPWLVVDIVALYRQMTVRNVPGCSTEQLVECLRLLAPDAAHQVTFCLVTAFWKSPGMLAGPLRRWIVGLAGGVSAERCPSFAPLLLNMLWNAAAAEAAAWVTAQPDDQVVPTIIAAAKTEAHAETVDMICALIVDGTNTASPCRLGLAARKDLVGKPQPEGYYEGYVQPLQHLLGCYVYLVSVLYPDGTTPNLPKLTQQHFDELNFIGLESRGERTAAHNAALGAAKVAMAKRILATLRDHGATMLTTFAAVEASEVMVAFQATGGSIWGFESIRLSLVQAVHLSARGANIARMWEMWNAINPVLDEGTYRRLTANPRSVIDELIRVGLAKFDDMLQDNPLEFPGVRFGAQKAAFRKAFIEQVGGYLSVLANLPPTTKFATAVARGHYLSKYGAAMACKAGLWWAFQQERLTGRKAHVYYCLDGVLDDDIIFFKTRKTDLINAHLGAPEQHDRYYEVTTLTEIREILLNWEMFTGTVHFFRMGTLVPDGDIASLIVLMRQQDDLAAGKRATPTRQQVIDGWQSKFKLMFAWDDPGFNGLSDSDFYHAVAQLHLLDLAAGADNPGALAGYLTGKGAKAFERAKLLPEGFGDMCRAMLSATDPEAKAGLAGQLLQAVQEGALPGGFKALLAEGIAGLAQLG